jgi:hypothetical protein
MRFVAFLALPILAGVAAAGGAAGDAAPAAALGARGGMGFAAAWRAAAGGGLELPAQETSEDPSAGAGASPRLKAIFLSLLLPGLGEYTAGDRTGAYVFFGAEAAIWGSYAALQIQGHLREDRYEEFAHVWAGVEKPEGRDVTYYSNLERYESYDQYRVVAIRAGDGDLYAGRPELHWAWTTDERRIRFQDLRSDADRSFHRSEFALAGALLNRLLSAIHVARSVRGSPRSSFSFHMRGDPTAGGGLVPTLVWRTAF